MALAGWVMVGILVGRHWLEWRSKRCTVAAAVALKSAPVEPPELSIEGLLTSHRILIADFRLPAGTIVECSPDWAQLFDETPQGLVNRSIWEVLSEESRRHIEFELASVSPQSPTVAFEYHHHPPAGRHKVYLVTAEVRFDPANGQPVECLSSGLEVTDLHFNYNRYYWMARHSTQVYLILDLEGRPVEINPAATRLTGYSHADLIERGRQIYPRAAAVIWRYIQNDRLYRRGLRSSSPKSRFVTAVASRDGRLRTLEGLINRLDERQTGGGYVVVFRDVTFQHRLAEKLIEQQKLFRTIVDHVPAAITWKDARQRFRGFNRQVAQMMGLTSMAQFRGRSIFAVPIPSALQESISQLDQQVAASGQSVEGMEVRLLTPTGREYDCIVYRHPYYQGRRLLGVISIWIDVTQERRASARLLEAFQEAQKASQSRTTFLAKVTHELRTPLTAIGGLARLLTRPDLADLHPQYSERLLASSLHLQRLVNDLLDFERLDSGHFELNERPTHLPTVLKELEALFLDAAQAKGLSLDFRLDPASAEWVWVDGLRLGQILNNLTSNAIRYSKAGCVKVRVQAVAAAPASVRWRFSVKDEGPGIAAQEMSRIFEPYFQGTREDNIGMGLGLPICQGLLLAMHSTLCVESQPGAGAEFSFLLDLRPASPPPSPSAEPLANSDEALHEPLVIPGSGTPNVLIIEDDEPTRYVLMAMLQSLGVRVRAEADGASGIRAGFEERFTHCVVDMNMPGLNGLEVVRMMRQPTADSPDRPVLAIVSAWVNDSLRREFLNAGADLVLTKPADLAGLREMLAFSKITGDPTSPAWAPAPNDFWETLLRDHLPQRHFDCDHLLQQISWRREGRQKLLAEMIEIYLKDSCSLCLTQDLNLPPPSLEELGRFSHRRKTMARLLGAMPLAELLDAMETLSRQTPPPAEWGDLHARIVTECQIVQSHLTAFLPLLQTLSPDLPASPQHLVHFSI